MSLGNRGFRLLAIITVGFPFCAFKVLTGMVVLAFPHGSAVGWALIALGVLDLVLNAIALGFELAGRVSPWPVCVAQWATARLGSGRASWSQLGLSLDAMLAFTLVALMIGLGWLGRLPDQAVGVWSLGVVLNVLGAGVGRLAESVAELEGGRA